MFTFSSFGEGGRETRSKTGKLEGQIPEEYSRVPTGGGLVGS